MINFSKIPGTSDLKKRLISRVEGNNLPNTLLLSGKEGGPALAVALALAKSLVCTELTTNGSCGACISCRQFDGHNYPDLHLSFPIERKGKESSSSEFKNRFLDLVEENPFITNQTWREALQVGNKQLLIPAKEAENIIHNLALTTFSKSPRVFILWQPELLNITSSNRLLKSLEEPGNNTYFILVSHHVEKILPTIMSRCVSFSVPNNTKDDMVTYLSGFDHTHDSISKSLLYAEGSIGMALDLLEDEATSNQQFDLLIEWLRALYAGNVNELVGWSENTSKLYREQLKQFITYTMQLFQQASGVSHNMHSGPLFKHQSFSIERFAPYIRVDKMDKILSSLERGYRDIERNGNPKIILLDLSLTLTKYIGKA